MRGRLPRPWLERLEAFVVPEPNSGCHLWIGSGTGGYGRMRLGSRGIDRHSHLTHRLVWELHHGPIPDGVKVLHRCDTPACVNVRHLFLGTMKDNSEDMMRKGRNHGRGHRLTAEQIQAIRQAKGTCRQRVAAQRFGVRQSYISAIWSGKKWAWMPWPEVAP